jgi:hypothetical protein
MTREEAIIYLLQNTTGARRFEALTTLGMTREELREASRLLVERWRTERAER